MSMKWPIWVCAGALAVSGVALAEDRARSTTGEIALAADMAESARRFLSSLSPAQRGRALFPFGADERVAWHYIPRSRRGVSLGELDAAQRALAEGFLATGLGRRGQMKASAIMALEEVLRRREQGRSGYVRDPRAYYLSVFGEPSASTTWGWRLEGHHLSINLTLVDGIRPVEAPVFFGAAPSRDGGEILGHASVLGREEELGFALLASLDGAQRRAAVYRATAPDDILTGPGAKLTPLPGLAASRMTPAQRRMLLAIVEEVVGNLPAEVAAAEHARIDAHGTAELLFTWAGGSLAGQPHYYRVSGPTFVYELDNTQEKATHVHTVWHVREKAGGDFGLDLLRLHYRDEAHAARSSTEAILRTIRTEWARAVEPFRIAGNLYYVGGENVASYLIATSQGLILIDSGPLEMGPVVRAGIVKLGFRLEDVKLLLNSHAHSDHIEGHASLARETGAKVMIMAADAPAVSSGIDGSALGGDRWEPIPIDRVLHDGDDVVLGEVTLHALWTPGHTPGCTTWTMTVRDHGRTYRVAIVGSPAANAGVKLRNNPRHPTIAQDLERTIRVLKTLRPDIYLTGHPADLFTRSVMERLRAGAQPNPLVSPKGYAALIAEAEADLRQRLRAEDAAAKSK